MNKRTQESVFQLKIIVTAAVLLVALTGSINAAADEDTVRVSFDKALLDTPAGIEKLHRKLKIRAGKECQHSVKLYVKQDAICRRDMVSRFLAEVDNLQLTHYASTGQHLRQQAKAGR